MLRPPAVKTTQGQPHLWAVHAEEPYATCGAWLSSEEVLGRLSLLRVRRMLARTVLGKAVVDRYSAVLADLGGEDNLTTIKRSLVRRFTWFEVMIEGMECRAAAGEPVDIGSWTQLTNSWLGIARMLGLERRQKQVRTLQQHLNGTAKAVNA